MVGKNILSLACILWSGTCAFSQSPLEAPTQPFNFDTFRKTPGQARTALFQGTKEGRDLHGKLVAGYAGRELSFSQQANGLFSSQEDFFETDPESIPSRQQANDQIAQELLSTDSKGRTDPLAKARLQRELALEALSDSDYELYISKWEAARENVSSEPDARLNPMPTLINSKTGGPPHAYAVSQAGVGIRSKPRSAQNPFGDWIQFLQLDQPITRGTDAWDRQTNLDGAATGSPENNAVSRGIEAETPTEPVSP